MEYADRGSLDAAIRARRFARPSSGPAFAPSFDVPAVLRCLADVAAGLAYLHSAGVVHGDLKPSNVLLKSAAADPRGFVAKLADFGLSRLIDVTVQTHVSTQTYGTVSYQPPEVLATGHLSPAADVYAFGLLAAELASGDKVGVWKACAEKGPRQGTGERWRGGHFARSSLAARGATPARPRRLYLNHPSLLPSPAIPEFVDWSNRVERNLRKRAPRRASRFAA